MRRSMHVVAGLRTRQAKWIGAASTVLFAAVALAVPALAGTPNTWTPAHSLTHGRFFNMGARLNNGNVLVVGGEFNSTTVLKSSEIYVPSSDVWTGGPDMGTGRFGGAAATLPSGKVLVAGGNDGTNNLNTGEVYDPTANSWTPVTNTMISRRGNFPAAVLLSNGQVLLAGGTGAGGTNVATADLYDPTQNKFLPAHAMGAARGFPLSAQLPGGRALVAGGIDVANNILASGEVYDPGSNTWTPVANSMSSPHAGAGAAALPSGKVLLAGGESATTPTTTATASTDIYDPAANTFSGGPAMSTSRVLFGMTALADGRVLATGGIAFVAGTGSVLSTSELYDPATNSWTATGSLSGGNLGFTTTLLPNGQVLLAGGTQDAQTGSTVAELYTPNSKPAAPSAVSATGGNGSATVSFAPPASDGGMPIQHYTITASTGQTATTADARTFASVPGLANDKSVTFTVTATNALGEGAPSAPSNAVTPTGPDKAPTVTLSGLKKKLKLKDFLKGVKFSIAPSKAASLQVSLLAGVNRATISRAFNLTLASKSFRLSAKTQKVKLVPKKKLVGHPRKAKVEVVIVATDSAGSRFTTTKTISVKR